MKSKKSVIGPFPTELTAHTEIKYVSPCLAPLKLASSVVVLNASSLPLPLTL